MSPDQTRDRQEKLASDLWAAAVANARRAANPEPSTNDGAFESAAAKSYAQAALACTQAYMTASARKVV